MSLLQKRILFLGGVIVLSFLVAGCIKQTQKNVSQEPEGTLAPQVTTSTGEGSEAGQDVTVQELPDSSVDTKINDVSQVVLKTNFGDITLQLFPQSAPKTVTNFVRLAEQDFYDKTKFHRVIKDFMIQAGDPNSKDDNWENDGSGGPGYQFEDEINPKSLGLSDEQIQTLEQVGYVYNYELESHKLTRGKIAMANAGPNTNGSQFFIVTAEETAWLDGRHTVFGEVTGGVDIVDAIEAVETDEQDHPKKDVVIEDVAVIRLEKVQEGGEGREGEGAATSSEEIE